MIDNPVLATDRLNAGPIRVATALGAREAETIDFFEAPAVLSRYP